MATISLRGHDQTMGMPDGTCSLKQFDAGRSVTDFLDEMEHPSCLDEIQTMMAGSNAASDRLRYL
jgi:hypothetical protein